MAGPSVDSLIEALPMLQQERDWTDFHFHAQAYFLDIPGIEVLPIGKAHAEIEAHTGFKLPHCNNSLGSLPESWRFVDDVKSLYAEDYKLCE
jgi:hypothetical protein